jgi:hypothetical protein
LAESVNAGGRKSLRRQSCAMMCGQILNLPQFLLRENLNEEMRWNVIDIKQKLGVISTL